MRWNTAWAHAPSACVCQPAWGCDEEDAFLGETHGQALEGWYLVAVRREEEHDIGMPVECIGQRLHGDTDIRLFFFVERTEAVGFSAVFVHAVESRGVNGGASVLERLDEVDVALPLFPTPGVQGREDVHGCQLQVLAQVGAGQAGDVQLWYVGNGWFGGF